MARMHDHESKNMCSSPLARATVLLALAGTKIRKRSGVCGVPRALMLGAAVWASAGPRASGMRVAT